ncbi:MAG TPA: DGQHR domain-containing protein [Methylocystis sp.]|nr:DGQHR domain-containing protein [Methylocystis sp.]
MDSDYAPSLGERAHSETPTAPIETTPKTTEKPAAKTADALAEPVENGGLAGAETFDANAIAAEEGEDLAAIEGDHMRDVALLVTQGRHRFYSLVMSSDLLASTCTVDTRAENPIDGFQRRLDKRRAREIAAYIDRGLGTAPSAVILSAQPRAQLKYDRTGQVLQFRKTKGAFLIIDGQHRIYGFHLAERKIKVPVVIYNKLTRAQECQLFMDINTKQRPVPTELLLDIRRLSEVETAAEAILHDLFDLFHIREDSALKGFMSPSERKKGLISRLTFNTAVKSVQGAFVDASAQDVYGVLNPFYAACTAGLDVHEAKANIGHAALFKALTLLFPDIAERVGERFDGAYSAANFEQILVPLFRRLKKNELPKPGVGHLALHEHYRKALAAGFSLKNWLFA